TFTFASADVAAGISISTSGYTLGGTKAGNYTLTQPTLSADITVATLTVTGLTGDNKVYDGNTTATASGAAALAGIIGGDDVILGGTPTFTFASADVAAGISISTSGYTLGGTKAGNYALTQPTLSADITVATLTVTGLTGDNKVYDGNTTATASGTAALAGIFGGDDVTLGGTPTFTFASADVAAGISISTSGYTLGGTKAGNYTLTQPTLSADITVATLTVTGLTGDNKVYDGTTTASASGTAALAGIIGSDDVTLGGTPTYTFASADVATGIAITTAGYTLVGTKATNYTLTQPTLSADITVATLTVTGLAGDNKVYDGNTMATASGTAALAGIIGGDDVTLGGTPTFTFASADVAAGISISTSSYTLGGTKAGNYTLTQPTLSADITVATLTVTGLTGNNKVYDGTTTATASGAAALAGIIGGDDVILGGTPTYTFASANVGTGISISTSGYTISGADAGNYGLTQPTLSGDITGGSITVVEDAALTEADLDARSLVVTLNGVVFVDGTLDAGNFILNNAPAGLSIESVTYDNASQATVALAFDGTDFDSDVTTFSMTLAAVEHNGTGDLVSVDLTISAIDDAETITITDDGLITEGAEDGELITVTLTGGTFVASLNTSNWTVANLPSGVTKGMLTRTSATTATIALSGNRDTDYDTDITNVTVTVTTAEFTDSTGDSDLSAGTGVTLTATDDAESITITDDGLITEGAEDGEIISVTLTGGEFVASLTPVNWTVSNLPSGVTKGTITRTGDTTATIALSGNRDTDYDSDIANVSVTITTDEYVDSTGGGDLAAISGVTLIATDDAESISIADDGSLDEGAEDGELITVAISGGEFAVSLNTANWSIGNLPSGVTKGTLTRTSDTTATIALSGNRDTDYDSDITNVSVIITADEFVDSTGDGSLLANSGVTIRASLERLSVVPAVPMTEANLDTNSLIVTLVGETFVDGILDSANVSLANLPTGASLESVVYDSPTQATVNLAFDGTDFDSDVTTLNITLAAAELMSGTDLTSGDLTITAINDSESISITDDGSITEGAEDGELVTITLTGGTFAASLNTANWTVTGLPSGVTKGVLTRISATSATLALSGNRDVDYDSDITNVTVTISTAEFTDSTGDSDLSAGSGVTLAAIDDAESITIADDGMITEGSEDGEIITITLTGGTFAGSLNSLNWTVTNLPAGVTVGALNRINSTTASLALLGNRSTDYDSDITTLTISMTTDEFDDSSGDSSLTANSGVTFTAMNDPESISIADDGQITEFAENGDLITVTLSGGVFAALLTTANWTVTNVPAGVSKGVVTRVTDTTATIALSGNATNDYDADITNVTVTITTDEYVSSGSDTTLSVDTGVTLRAKVEAVAFTPDGPLAEPDLDQRCLYVTVINDTFVSGILSTDNFVLNNAPVGVTIESIVYNSPTEAVLNLAHDGADFDSDISNFSVTVGASELASGTALTTAVDTITALDDPEYISIFDDGGITEGAEDGEVITVVIVGGDFATLISDANWTLTNLPAGVTTGTVDRVSDNVVRITLSGNSTVDYDTDITNVTLAITASEYTDSTGGGSLSDNSGVTLTAVIETPEISISGNGVEIVDGDTTPSTTDDTDYGDVFVGDSKTATFIIANAGNRALLLTGTPRVSISGSSEFTVTAQPSGSVASSGSETFMITFSPTFSGTHAATVSIDNDDADENPYTFDIAAHAPSTTVNIETDVSTVNVFENGTGTFQVRLTADPGASTTVTVVHASGDTDISVTGGASLVFTSADWNAYQTVILSASEDVDTVNGSAAITCSASGIAIVNVTAVEVDNDTAGIVVSPSAITVAENGGVDGFTVVLTSPPTTDVTIDLTVDDSNEATVDAAQLVFSTTTWNIPQTVTVTGVDDAMYRDDTTVVTVSVNGALSDDSYDALPDQTVDVTCTDDEEALTLAIDQSTISENGGTATATVTRFTSTVADMIVNLTSDTTSKATVPATVTIAAGQSATSFTVTAVDDSIADGTATVVIIASVTGGPVASSSISVTDDDTPELSLSVGGSRMPENGGSLVGLISRNTDTTLPLTVTLTSSNPSAASVPATVEIVAGQTTATFIITGVDDNFDNDDRYVVITAAAPGYDAGSVPIVVEDDEVGRSGRNRGCAIGSAADLGSFLPLMLLLIVAIGVRYRASRKRT
ncbi:hypothetical protein BVX99_01545, partial [bacterium F16]